MSFILITADFPGVRVEEMGEIYKRLKNGSWEKRHDHNGVIEYYLDDFIRARHPRVGGDKNCAGKLYGLLQTLLPANIGHTMGQ